MTFLAFTSYNIREVFTFEVGLFRDIMGKVALGAFVSNQLTDLNFLVA